MSRLTNNRWMWCLAVLMASTALFGCNGVALPGSGDGDTASDVVDDADAGDANLVIFIDDAEGSTFTTTDVRDVDDEIVQIDSDTMSIVWKDSGEMFQAGSWVTNGNFLGAAESFQVRFGTVGGERRAYFTETGPATICDIRVADGNLRISATSTLVPNE